jgi:O-antigen ligase
MIKLPSLTMPLEPLTKSTDCLPTPGTSPIRTIAAADWPVAILAVMMFLVPAVGVPNELMLQDTLKSALVAFGVLTAALVFFWQQRQRTEPLLWHGMVWLPVALMLYALGSMVWSHTYLAGVEAIRWFILSLLMWLGLNTFTRRNLPLLLWGIHGGAVVASLWVALQFWFDLSWFPQAAAPSSTFINRNFFAEYAVSVLPFSVWLLANLRVSRWLGWVAASLALNVVALMMTGTRSALVAFVLLVPVMVLILIRYRLLFAFVTWSRAQQTLVALVLLIGIGGLGSVPSVSPTIVAQKIGTTALERSFVRTASMAEGKEYTEGSFSIRSQMWMATARMMLDKPWTGVGAGAWEVQIPLYQRHYTVLETDYYAHNEFLQLLSEYGVVVGGLCLAFLLAYLAHTAGSTFRLSKSSDFEAPMRAVELASFLTLLIVSNAGFPWHLAGCGALLALGLGALAASDARLIPEKAHRSNAHLMPARQAHAMVFMLLACLALAAYITGQSIKAERKIVHAIHLGNFLGQQLPTPARPEVERKAEMLSSLREGIAIHPHYRKFTAIAAEQLSASGDYANAVWVLETVVASRPHVPALWYGLAINYAQLGNHERANAALQQVQRLKPDAIDTLTLRVTLLSKSGKDEQAVALVNELLDTKKFDFEFLQTGYALGLKTHNDDLAVRSLELFNQTWPEHAADTYFRLGNVYANSLTPDVSKAFIAFKQGLAAVPANEKGNYIQQLPERFRSQM